MEKKEKEHRELIDVSTQDQVLLNILQSLYSSTEILPQGKYIIVLIESTSINESRS